MMGKKRRDKRRKNLRVGKAATLSACLGFSLVYA
jgi:hypothetical protein